jgi:hypothetical protein
MIQQSHTDAASQLVKLLHLSFCLALRTLGEEECYLQLNNREFLSIAHLVNRKLHIFYIFFCLLYEIG